MNTVTIETKLDKNFLKKEEIKNLLGKEVENSVTAIEEKEYYRKKLLEIAGSWDIGGKLVCQELSNDIYKRRYFSSDQGGKTGVMP